MRTVFAGSPDFAATILDRLITTPFAPVAVFTQPDRPHGRGRKVVPTPVKAAAMAMGLPVEAPTTLRNGGAELLASYRPDVFIVAAYGLILPRDVLEVPPLGCINVHASLLPHWRGAAPIERAYLAGDTTTGVSIMQMDEGLDTGPVYSRISVPIKENSAIEELQAEMANVGATALINVLEALSNDPPPTPEPQSEAGTYAEKLTAADRLLDWSLPATMLARRVNAMADRAPVRQTCNGLTMQWLAALDSGQPATGQPGTVIELNKKALAVNTATNQLHITRFRVEGGKGTIIDAAALRNGYRDALVADAACQHPE